MPYTITTHMSIDTHTRAHVHTYIHTYTHNTHTLTTHTHTYTTHTHNTHTHTTHTHTYNHIKHSYVWVCELCVYCPFWYISYSTVLNIFDYNLVHGNVVIKHVCLPVLEVWNTIHDKNTTILLYIHTYINSKGVLWHCCNVDLCRLCYSFA